MGKLISFSYQYGCMLDVWMSKCINIWIHDQFYSIGRLYKVNDTN